MELKDIVAVINPNSGNKQAEIIRENILNEYPKIHCEITETKEAFNDFMYLNIGKYRVFIIAGGDGTVNAAADYLAGKNKIMAVYPTGSGNGFARELGFKQNIRQLIEDIRENEVMNIDVLEVNGNICVNMAGLGFDAAVAHDFAASDKRGFFSYAKLTVASAFSFPAFDAEIQTGDKTFSGKYKMISVANTRQFGNNAIIAPKARPDDGFMDLVLLKDIPTALMVTFGARLMTGKLKSSRYLDFHKCNSEIIIHSDFKQYHIDGDPKTFDKELRIKLSDKKLKLIQTRHNKL
jgi:YegS/Rv2252/BmrU family lipid kinase